MQYIANSGLIFGTNTNYNRNKVIEFANYIGSGFANYCNGDYDVVNSCGVIKLTVNVHCLQYATLVHYPHKAKQKQRLTLIFEIERDKFIVTHKCETVYGDKLLSITRSDCECGGIFLSIWHDNDERALKNAVQSMIESLSIQYDRQLAQLSRSLQTFVQCRNLVVDDSNVRWMVYGDEDFDDYDNVDKLRRDRCSIYAKLNEQAKKIVKVQLVHPKYVIWTNDALFDTTTFNYEQFAKDHTRF